MLISYCFNLQLNEKLNHKKRRPSKNETDSILLDHSNLRSSTRQTRNKKLQNSISIEKMEIDDEDKENSVIGAKGKSKCSLFLFYFSITDFIFFQF